MDWATASGAPAPAPGTGRKNVRCRLCIAATPATLRYLWGAATRVTPGTLPALVTAARDAAQQISTKLGWSGNQRRAGIVPHLKDDDVEEQEHEVADDEEAAG